MLVGCQSASLQCIIIVALAGTLWEAANFAMPIATAFLAEMTYFVDRQLLFGMICYHHLFGEEVCAVLCWYADCARAGVIFDLF